MRRIYPPHAALTREMLVLLVEQTLDDGIQPIDTVITEALYPRGAPSRWGDWSDEAKDIHLEALEIHCERRRQILSGAVAHVEQKITPSRAWAVLLESAASAAHVRLTWPDIAQRLGVRQRRAEYVIRKVLRFRFSGRDDTRHISWGPCVLCGAVYPTGVLGDALQGPCCAKSQAA